MKSVKVLIYKFCLLSMFFIILNVEADAKNYYVDNNPGQNCVGNYSMTSRNCTGSDGSSYTSIIELDGVAREGDTIYVRGGSYLLQNETWDSSSGSSGSPITIKAFEEETPILHAGGTKANIFHINYVSWIVIDGLEFTDTGGYGIIIHTAHHITIKNSYFHDMGGEIEGWMGSAITAGCGSLDKHTYEEVWACRSTYVTVENNTFKSINGGHSVYANVGSENWIIRNNYMSDQDNGPAIQCKGCINTNIYNNVGYFETGTARWFLIISSEKTDISLNIYNNTVYIDCSGINNPSAVCRGIDLYYTDESANIILKNNIIYGNSATTLLRTSGNGDVADTDYNLYYPSKPSLDIGANSKSGNPQFVDISNKEFMLSGTDSPAHDAGTYLSLVSTDINNNQRDSKPDIGAYEYGSIPQCSDGIDNDGDGTIDLNDKGCSSLSDNYETNASSSNDETNASSSNDETNASSSDNYYKHIITIDPIGTYIDAENFTGIVTQGVSKFPLVNNAISDYAGSGYLQTAGEITLNCSNVAEGIEYQVNFTETGTYNIWIRGYATDLSSDSLFIGLDGNCLGRLWVNIKDSWIWTNVVGAGVNEIDIKSPGIHAVNIWSREPNLFVDGIYLTKSTEAPPDEIALLDNIPPAPPIGLVIE